MRVQSPQIRVPAHGRGVRSSMRKRGNFETRVQDNCVNCRRRSPLSANVEIDFRSSAHGRVLSATKCLVEWQLHVRKQSSAWYDAGRQYLTRGGHSRFDKKRQIHALILALRRRRIVCRVFGARRCCWMADGYVSQFTPATIVTAYI